MTKPMRFIHYLITLTLSAFPAIAPPCAADEASSLATGWKHQVEVGINGSSGNTDATHIHAGYAADYADEQGTWKLVSAYDKSESDGEASRDQFFADLKKAWLWPDSPWFAFGQGRYDRDRFKDWDYRIAASGGIGYQLLQSDTWDIAGRLGLGGHLSRGEDYEMSTPEIIVALDAAWTITEREALSFTTAFYPSLDEAGEYRNLTTLDWIMKITEPGRLSMKLGLSNEYDSLASDESEKNDFKYHLSLVWEM